MPHPAQPFLDNRLPEVVGPYAAILGDRPSHYSKSPAVWNATLNALGLPGCYVAMDVSEARFESLVEALRGDPDFRGGNVTLPHKVAILPLLDEVEPHAARIGAVNTLARTAAGGLRGYNTDAPAGVQALLHGLPGDPPTPLRTPAPAAHAPLGARALILGTGGAARALGFALAEALGPNGKLWIASRDFSKALNLASALNAGFDNAHAAEWGALSETATQVDVIINATSVGQQGSQHEQFSPLAEVASDAHSNQEASLHLLRRVPPETVVWDIVYAPAETILLRQARETGHHTQNGRSMLLIQAALAFTIVFRAELEAKGWKDEGAYRKVLEIMASQ